jgi:Family of unknown function (DUF5947)
MGMDPVIDLLHRGSFASLRQFVQRPQARERAELCELCAAKVGPVHQHLLDLDGGRMLCSCDPCAILFVDESRQRYRRVPRDVDRIDFSMDDAEWDGLQIPIRLAFFVYVSQAQRMVAYYPSPAGAMESSLNLEDWDAIAARNPILRKVAPDVEALLVSRLSEQPRYYRAPIDQCYRLVGTIRLHWHGFSGGDEVWKAIDQFFRQLDEASGVRCA